jgi:hypothetical protein
MGGWRIGAIAAALALAAAVPGIQLLRGAGAIPITSYFLRSEEELRSLRRALTDSSMWAELESLSRQMSLWTVSSETVAAAPGEDCQPLSTPAGPGEKVVHRFEFASRKGMSTRVFRLEVEGCKPPGEEDPGVYTFRLARNGFGSAFHLGREPLARGIEPLKVLRLALHDPGVSAALIETLREKDLAFTQVTRESDEDPLLDAYRFVAADGTPGEPGTTMEIRYEVAYDPVNDTASFARLP